MPLLYQLGQELWIEAKVMIVDAISIQECIGVLSFLKNTVINVWQ